MTVHRSTDMTEPTHSTTHTAPSSDTHGETSMTAVDTPPTDTSFAARVKSETQDAHDRAEHSHFMGDLLGGKLDRGAYVALLEQYLHLYRALEETERRFAGAPELAGVLDSRLDRVASLEADLADLREGAAPAAPTAANAEYVERLTALPADAPERYFAHHYLRYLGDLSGGQIIGRLAGRHYEIPAESLRTWTFEGIEKHKPYKDQYRVALDTAPLTEAQREAFIDEAQAGFLLAKKLFDSLA